MTKHSYWPAPVYVGTLADGSTGRMSFWSQEGKPLDLRRGRSLVSWAYGQPVVSGIVLHDGREITDTMDDAAIKPHRLPAKKIAAQALQRLDAGDTAGARELLRRIA